MTTVRTIRLSLLAAASAAVLTLGGTLSAAAASGETMQERVDMVLLEYPGGTQIAPNEVAWEDGTVVLTLAATDGIAPFAVGSCATGSYCAYNGSGLSGSKMTFSTCGTYSTTALGAVRSVANARTSGYVAAKNSSGRVLATVSSGSSTSYAPAGITQLTCVP